MLKGMSPRVLRSTVHPTAEVTARVSQPHDRVTSTRRRFVQAGRADGVHAGFALASVMLSSATKAAAVVVVARAPTRVFRPSLVAVSSLG
jgi:hypothetical protein